MTSFVLRSVQDRPSSFPARDDNCTFCRIVAEKSGAYVVYEDEDCMAFLGESFAENAHQISPSAMSNIELMSTLPRVRFPTPPPPCTMPTSIPTLLIAQTSIP